MSLDASKKAPSERAGGGKRVWLQRITAWGAAAVLLAAAVLKGWPLATGQAVETQATSLLKLLLIQGEGLLALWLVSGIGAAWAFRAALVFFAGAAAVNLRSIWLGEVSCGCFGKLEVPPAASLGINGVLLAALAGFRPRLEGGLYRNAVSALKSVGWVAPACVLIVGLGAAGALSRSYFRPVVIEAPKEIDLGELVAGEKKEVTITLRNLSDKPVTILGAKTSCSCLKIVQLARTIDRQQLATSKFVVLATENATKGMQAVGADSSREYCDSFAGNHHLKWLKSPNDRHIEPAMFGSDL